MNIQENVSLAPYTTLEVGGLARFFITCRSETEIIRALEFAKERDLQTFVLGGGSNVVVSDKGFDGVVIAIAIDRSENRMAEHLGADLGTITVGAGENWDSFVRFCVENDLAGVECLSGIPGSVGGTPVQNVGAYGQEVSETIEQVRCIDTQTAQPLRLTGDECRFSYRESLFNTSDRGRYIIYDVTFRLMAGGAPKIVYKDLIKYFDGRRPTLLETRRAVLNIRSSKSMVIDADDPNRRSAGSFFKNPVISDAEFDRIRDGAITHVPSFPHIEGHVKIPAAWLIENAGFYKGYALGNAGISTKHTLAIINRGGATAREIIELKDRIQHAVSAKFNIELVPEPIFVGDF